MKVLHTFVLLLFLLFNYPYSQITPEIVNCHIYDGPGAGIDMVNDMTKDVLNQFYLAGRSVGIDGTPDLTLIKYSNTLDSIMTIRYVSATNSWEEANSIIIDSSNNIYITGNAGYGQSYSMMVLLKYSNFGDLIWERNFFDTTNVSSDGLKVILDSDENPIVGGVLGSKVFLYKCSSNGDSLWSTIITSDTCSYYLNNLIIDNQDNIYLAMIQYIWPENEFPETNVIIRKYDSAGLTSWSKTIPISPDATLTNIKLDHDSNLVLMLNNLGRILKYDQTGILLWENNSQTSTYPVPFLSDNCIDFENSIIVTGYGPGIGLFDYMTKKVSSTGQDVWFQQFNGPENIRDFATGICVDDFNNVYITGSTHDMINTGTSYTIRYAIDGQQDWILKFDAPHSRFEDPIKIMLDDSNNVFIGGDVADSTNGWNFYICKIRQKVGTKIISTDGELPYKFYLYQCYPNPFNANTKINFRIPYANEVKLDIYNVAGMKVKELIHGYMSAGEHVIDFKADNLPSGIYYYRLVIDGFEDCKKAILLK